MKKGYLAYMFAYIFAFLFFPELNIFIEQIPLRKYSYPFIFFKFLLPYVKLL